MTLLLTTQAKRDAWAAAGYLGNCRDGVWYNLLYFGKTIGGVPIIAVDAYRAHEMVLKATGYTPVSRWALNMRKITGGSKPCTCASYDGCSPHSFGCSIDIDPTLNPYTSKAFSWNATAFTKAQIEAVEAIRNTKGEQVWAWGGRWRSVRDYMHFDIQVDPRSLQINWTTVKGYNGGSSPVPPMEGYDDMLGFKVGKVGDPVEPFSERAVKLQLMLKDRGHDPQGTDGRIGNNSRSALIAFQTANAIGLPEKGAAVIGPYTDAAFERGIGGGGGLTQTQADSRYAKLVHPHTIK